LDHGLDKAQWIAVPTRTPTRGLCALAVYLAVGCGPTIDGRPLGTGPVSSTSPGDSIGLSECEQIEVPTELGFLPEIFWYYRQFEDQKFGDEVLLDTFNLAIYTDEEGSYDLAEGDNQSYATCMQCVLIDVDQGTKFFFQESGRIEVDAGSAPSKGKLETDLVNVKLVEVEIDADSFATTRVEGGECLEIVDVEVTSLKIEGWTCPTGYYGSGDGCDCGCGVTDPDCDSERANVCTACDVPGSCAVLGGSCPGVIDPDDNSQCDVATAWTCDLALYDAGDGQCDCGCGLVDPDCNSNTLASACDTCFEPGSCIDPGATSCIGAINGANNATCTPVPGWTCDPTYYGAQDGCDCGCGVKDPDCSGGDASACEFCNEAGSCAQDAMGCGAIDDKDTSQCGS
jgi:hypothetical protein